MISRGRFMKKIFGAFVFAGIFCFFTGVLSAQAASQVPAGSETASSDWFDFNGSIGPEEGKFKTYVPPRIEPSYE